jgi:hypothetical protein
MQPCEVCGGVTTTPEGYCSVCGTFRGPPPNYQQQPYGAAPGYPPPATGSPAYPPPTSGAPGYPNSAPPGGYPTSGAPGYAPPTSGGGYPTTGYPPPPSTGGSRAKPFVIPLVALSVTLIVLVIGIVTVFIVRNSSKGTPDGGGSTAAAGDVDPCVVGRWEITSHREDVAMDEVGKVTFTGGEGAVLELSADGKGVQDYGDGTDFDGTANGKTIELEISGKISFDFTARDGTVSVSNLNSEATAKTFLDGEEYGSAQPFPGDDDPSKYECSGDTMVQRTFHYETQFEKVQ